MDTLFGHCPACGAGGLEEGSATSYRCSRCEFVFFMNPAAAVAAIIEHDDEILFAVRAREPDAGKLDLPGGFVDCNETAEEALARELDEELGLGNVCPEYLCSFPNSYPYAGVNYRTIDLIYRVILQERPVIRVADDVSGVVWVRRDAIPMRRVAFQSIRKALEFYRK